MEQVTPNDYGGSLPRLSYIATAQTFYSDFEASGQNMTRSCMSISRINRGVYFEYQITLNLSCLLHFLLLSIDDFVLFLKTIWRNSKYNFEGWYMSAIWFPNDDSMIVLIMALYLNLFWPSDTIWRQRSGSTLAQVMACCLTAPSHYLNQCWRIISEVQWHSY